MECDNRFRVLTIDKEVREAMKMLTWKKKVYHQLDTRENNNAGLQEVGEK